jgi:hypothetical protein
MMRGEGNEIGIARYREHPAVNFDGTAFAGVIGPKGRDQPSRIRRLCNRHTHRWLIRTGTSSAFGSFSTMSSKATARTANARASATLPSAYSIRAWRPHIREISLSKLKVFIARYSSDDLSTPDAGTWTSIASARRKALFNANWLDRPL